MQHINTPIANRQLGNINKTNSQLDSSKVDSYLAEYSHLIEPKYLKWFAKRFYKLTEQQIAKCASEARADGNNPKRLFCYLIKKNG